jgi:hypothetical protein
MMLSIQIATESRKQLDEAVIKLENEIKDKTNDLEQVRKDLYEASLRELHIKEIYRLAKIQFSRLLQRDLNTADIEEIEKWIGRAKCIDSLAGIANALNELQKYLPADIRSNLYALVQKIIIGGAFHQKRRRV